MWKWLILSGFIVGIDQFSKQLAEHWLTPYQPLPIVPFFNLTLAYNSGAAFSFLADAGGWQRWFFLALALVVSGVLTVWIVRLKPGESRQAAALALILSGAVGNLIDRALFGHVIDFLDVYYGQWHWPAFNIADSAICIGATLLIIDSLFSRPVKSADHGTD